MIYRGFFSKIQYSWSLTFSQCCKCSMVTIKIHGRSSSGKVFLLLAAMLELAFTTYAPSSVFSVGLYLFCSLFSCQFILILHVCNGYCLSCGTFAVFCVVPPSTFWNIVLRWRWIAMSCGNFVIKLWPIFSLQGLNEKKQMGLIDTWIKN